jgi:DNA mismatch repair protein MutS
VPIDIVPRGEDIFYGFGVDGNQRFLLPDGTVVHNSTLMKSVGVAMIMAQTGMYVPTATMQFSPIRSIFTKIGTLDNIWKGRSTFITEMNELRHILSRSDSESLILCDELTAGTETFSATGIVAATVRRLLEKDSQFILTTHLHTLKRFQELMADERLQVCYLGMEYDAVHKKLVFDRILRKGFGRSVYGLEIAEYLGFDPEFLKNAFEFRGRLDDESTLRRSRYNTKKWMDRCERCGTAQDLHTHHIAPQRLASEDGYIGVYKKNVLFNLMTLCRACHEKEHHQQDCD